ncbi:hypothetical protein A0J61_05429 [Choanephora cucurbitarum]|uniref:Tc1-like transposase DDE domain-containing protein n=1 Tax=Choanephora cucurbitarum TaxID=101091 RepID=A0A1C7NBR4_9FUNG|nr:hypothetical protein A0J61_05429 [Choanephora cucurbitarum]
MNVDYDMIEISLPGEDIEVVSEYTVNEEHEDDELSNNSDEEEADVQSSESDLKEEKSLRDLTGKRDDTCNARLEQVPIKDAALKTGTNEEPACRFKLQGQITEEILQKKKRGRATGAVFEFNEKHSRFVIELVDECSTTAVAGTHESLIIQFSNLSKISVTRNSEEALKKRKETILQWLADKEMDFENNCVFLDEAGFNLHMTRTRGWSKKGAPAKTTVPASKGTTIIILTAISSAGVIGISLESQ